MEIFAEEATPSPGRRDYEPHQGDGGIDEKEQLEEEWIRLVTLAARYSDETKLVLAVEFHLLPLLGTGDGGGREYKFWTHILDWRHRSHTIIAFPSCWASERHRAAANCRNLIFAAPISP
jgi:hypothetical protein